MKEHSRQWYHEKGGKAWHQRDQPQRRDQTFSWVDELKNVPCVDCNQVFPSVAMDFDHRPGETKVAAISVLINRRVREEVLLAEIVKCDIVCSNCHRVRTAERGQWRRGKFSEEKRPDMEHEDQ